MICLVMISCEKENLSPVRDVTSNQSSNSSSSNSSSSSKCTGCSEWQYCGRVGTGGSDWFSTSSTSRCVSVFRHLQYSGSFVSTHTFSDSTSNSISKLANFTFPYMNDGYSATLNLPYNTYSSIDISFTSDYDLDNYYNFIVRNCTIYNPITQSNMVFEGTGSFTHDDDSCCDFSVEINLQSTSHNGNFSYKLVGQQL
jgi:hypothetical protein